MIKSTLSTNEQVIVEYEEEYRKVRIKSILIYCAIGLGALLVLTCLIWFFRRKRGITQTPGNEKGALKDQGVMEMKETNGETANT
jgi:hypothetical protein